MRVCENYLGECSFLLGERPGHVYEALSGNVQAMGYGVESGE